MKLSSERDAQLALWCVDDVGIVRYRALIAGFGSAGSALEAGPMQCAEQLNRPSLRRRFEASWPSGWGADRWDALARSRAIHRSETDFPGGLRALGDPAWVFVRGDVDALHVDLAAVVGTRSVRPEGIRLTSRVIDWLAEQGWHTCSGGALGVDGEVHRRSLELGLRTVVVLPAGLDHQVPSRHQQIFESICASRGLVLTEQPPWRRPRPQLFVRRNRLISGLSALTIVVRAPTRSGALVTVDWARRQNRGVYAVPGSPDDRTAEGCIDALRNGAKLLASVADLPVAPNRSPKTAPATGLSPTARTSPTTRESRMLQVGLSPEAELVLELLADGARPLVELVQQSALDAGCVLGSLTRLTLTGLVTQVGPGLYRRKQSGQPDRG